MRKSTIARLVTGVAALALGATAFSAPASAQGVAPLTLTKLAPITEAAQIGGSFPAPLRVRATRAGKPVAGVVITFAALPTCPPAGCRQHAIYLAGASFLGVSRKDGVRVNGVLMHDTPHGALVKTNANGIATSPKIGGSPDGIAKVEAYPVFVSPYTPPVYWDLAVG
jgi:hypothetical protein